MKRVVIILCTFGILSFICFAQSMAGQKGGIPPSVSKKSIKLLEVRGQIDSIYPAEPSMGIRARVILNGEDGKTYTFIVRAITTIYGPDWKAISLDKLMKGQKIRVQYIDREGFLEAQSIKPVLH
jgi:hypothetical protein